MKKTSSLSLAGGIMLFAAVAGFMLQTAPVRKSSNDDLNASTIAALRPPAPAIDSIPQVDTWTRDAVPQRLLNYEKVGMVTLYGNLTKPAALILFLSGDGGLDIGFTNMAKTLAQNGQTLVVAIDVIKYYKKLQASSGKCLYPAGDLESLSEFVQKTLTLPNYHKPILVGYSSGATLTYALLCQAPAGTFRGGIALGFCPEIEVDKPLCEGSGKLTMTRRKDGKGYDFTDQPAPATMLEVLHGELDQDCLCKKTSDFFDNIRNVHVVKLPKVGHGYAVVKNWLPQFKQAFARILAATDRSTGMLLPAPGNKVPVANATVGKESSSSNLPLSITTATADAATPMVLFLSGDGGWTGFDQQICDQLAANHIPTVGLNSQSYFWQKKTPEQTVADLAPVIRQYLQAWSKSKILLVGYSFGANIVPFIYNRLPVDLHNKVQDVVMLSSDTKGDFEIHVAGMLGKSGGPYDVAAEVRSLQNTTVLCVSGDQEGNEVQTELQGTPHVRFKKIPGSHHYNNDAIKVAATIMNQ